jgi:hypothetical protein
MVTNPPPPAPSTARPTAECPECRSQVPVTTEWRFQAHVPDSATTDPNRAPCPGSGTKPIRPSLRATSGSALRSTPTVPPPADWLN